MKASLLAFCLCSLLVGVASAADSLHMRLVGEYVDTHMVYFDVKVRGDYAYIAGNEAFVVLSVSDPAHPVELGRDSAPILARPGCGR